MLASAPLVLVAPSNALSARYVTVEGTGNELFLYPDGAPVEPSEVAASAVEVSVLPTYEHLSYFAPVL